MGHALTQDLLIDILPYGIPYFSQSSLHYLKTCSTFRTYKLSYLFTDCLFSRFQAIRRQSEKDFEMLLELRPGDVGAVFEKHDVGDWSHCFARQGCRKQ